MSIIGITMGCPAGVGPEIILKYFSQLRNDQIVTPVVLGDLNVLEKCRDELGLDSELSSWQPGQPVPPKCIPVLSLSSLEQTQLCWGQPNIDTARAMVKYIQTAVDLCLDGSIDAMTTCPIAKDSLQQAGFSYPGHTEMLVELTGAEKYTMMMAGKTLKVTLATIHCAFSEVPTRLTTEALFELITLTGESLQTDYGIEKPRIGVAGLNPHSGEKGLFGCEEETIIRPAIDLAVNAGLNVNGPFPPDTVFHQAAGGKFDCVVCMYHDQGLIPFKLLHFKDGVNVTLGLPIVRTSVDHGTAYDIAGKGIADPASLEAAVHMAAEIAAHRKQRSNRIPRS